MSSVWLRSLKPKRHEDPDYLEYIKKNAFCVPHHGNCQDPIEVHHLKSVGSGGGDHAWNCLPTCRQAHQNIHAIGLAKACIQYPALKKWLLIFNWELDTKTNRWRFYGGREAADDTEEEGQNNSPDSTDYGKIS